MQVNVLAIVFLILYDAVSPDTDSTRHNIIWCGARTECKSRGVLAPPGKTSASLSRTFVILICRFSETEVSAIKTEHSLS